MSYDVWKTLYTGDFDSSKYLYHYTSMDKAIKIIHSNELRFSHIGRTNDTSESKLKIIYIHSTTKETLCMDERIEKVSKYFKEYHNIVRLLCFSMDSIIKEKEKNLHYIYIDVAQKTGTMMFQDEVLHYQECGLNMHQTMRVFAL